MFQGRDKGDLDYTVEEILTTLAGLRHTEMKTRICSRIPSVLFYTRSLHWVDHQRKSEHDEEESVP